MKNRMQIGSTYIYQTRNLMPCLWQRKWKKGDKGLFFLVGKTGSGKTEFLKSFEKSLVSGKECSETNVGWYTCEDLVDGIICKINGQSINILNLDKNVIIVENFEELSNKEYIKKEVMDLLQEYSDSKTIICTATEIMPEMKKHKVVRLCNARINRGFIERMAYIMLDKELSRDEIKRLRRMRLKSVSSLKGEIRMISLNSKMGLK